MPLIAASVHEYMWVEITKYIAGLLEDMTICASEISKENMTETKSAKHSFYTGGMSALVHCHICMFSAGRLKRPGHGVTSLQIVTHQARLN